MAAGWGLGGSRSPGSSQPGSAAKPGRESCPGRPRVGTVADVSCIYSAEYAPDPYDALDVLAFVLCPIRAFAPTGDAAELEAAAEMIGPAKAEAIRRWHEQRVTRTVN